MVNEEKHIAEQQKKQDKKAAEAAKKAVAKEGGVHVKEFEDTASTVHGI